MKTAILSIIFAASSSVVSGQVVGTPTGFGSGTTGGGSATPAVPSDTAELVKWLTDSTARVIMLDKEYNFIGTEGSVTETGCRPSSNTCPGNGGQDAINSASWCTNGNAGTTATSVSVTYDKAGLTPINVASNKSIVGKGSKGVIRGKGLRMANGAKNVIIQNIHITELNPQYIWGGDAITLAGTDNIWIDHVKISLIGRQMFVSGYTQAGKVTVSNSEFDGQTSWSATCNGRHYWTFLVLGSSDFITMTGNYIHHTSGRGPKLGGTSVVHAVNNYWYSTSGHAFDVESGANALIEGNVFESVTTPLLSSSSPGQVFAAPDATTNKNCQTALGRVCQVNQFSNSGTLTGTSTSFFSNFSGKNIATAVAVTGVKASVIKNAGIGKIN